MSAVVFGGFAAKELATRIEDAKPKVMVSASCGIEVKKVIAYKPLLDEAIKLSSAKPEKCIILQRPMEKASMIAGRDVDWTDAMATAQPHDCVPVAATDPLYILYTSGTTGQPKGVVRDNGGHMVALKWTMKNVYDVEAGDVYWAASDVGWVVGHSYIVYGPLANGATTVMFESTPVYPDATRYWGIVEDLKVNIFYTAPTAIRAIAKFGDEPVKAHDRSSLRVLGTVGEPINPDVWMWYYNVVGDARSDLGLKFRLEVMNHAVARGGEGLRFVDRHDLFRFDHISRDHAGHNGIGHCGGDIIFIGNAEN